MTTNAALLARRQEAVPRALTHATTAYAARARTGLSKQAVRESLFAGNALNLLCPGSVCCQASLFRFRERAGVVRFAIMNLAIPLARRKTRFLPRQTKSPLAY